LRLDGKGNIVDTGKLILNGHDRFAERDGHYFNYVQPSEFHTRTPCDGINVYSFGTAPEQHQPSGTSNMSRIDSAILKYKTKDELTRDIDLNIYDDTETFVFAPNYNILRVMSGMAGVAYSN
jgi:hypothetical protein